MYSRSSPNTLRARLWKGWFLLAVLIASLVIASFALPQKQANTANGFGLDYIAFYRAGVIVQSGHVDRLYDLQDARDFDRALAQRENLSLGDKYGPSFYPPFFAWLFVPLVGLGYFPSLIVWSIFNLLCFAAAATLLSRLMPSRDWRIWALVPALMATSFPFIQAVGHGQNTFLSLLIVTWAVIEWRKGQAYIAGFAAGILFFKPQLTALILAAMIVTLGWRALAGAGLSIGSYLLVNILTLPGSLGDYLHRLGPEVQYFMATHSYLWQRHATFNGFWHVLLHANSLATILAIICAIPLAGSLFLCIWRNRNSVSRDPMIAAVITSAPLLTPYYLDYDLLLLAIPAVLLAIEIHARDSWLVRSWIALYVLLFVNPALTSILHVNLSVPLLATVAVLQISRAFRMPHASQAELETPANLLHRPLAA